jgi:hypothetical protein
VEGGATDPGYGPQGKSRPPGCPSVQPLSSAAVLGCRPGAVARSSSMQTRLMRVRLPGLGEGLRIRNFSKTMDT